MMKNFDEVELYVKVDVIINKGKEKDLINLIKKRFPEFIDTYYANENLQITVCKSDKPQPKEPQYLYVYQDRDDMQLFITNGDVSCRATEIYLGKIKLEVDDD